MKIYVLSVMFATLWFCAAKRTCCFYAFAWCFWGTHKSSNKCMIVGHFTVDESDMSQDHLKILWFEYAKQQRYNLVRLTYIIHSKTSWFWCNRSGSLTYTRILIKAYVFLYIYACVRLHSATEWLFRSQFIETKHCVFQGCVDGPCIFTRVWHAWGVISHGGS